MNLPKRVMTVRTCKDGKKRGGFAKKTPAEFERDFYLRIARPDSNGCRLWIGARAPVKNNRLDCYGVTAWINGKSMRAHRLALMLHDGLTEPPAELFACHKCDVKLCCEATHLYWGTAADNSADAVARGRTPTGDRSGSRKFPECRPRGENHPFAKITCGMVLEIFKLRAGGMMEHEIAKKFNLASVSPILNRISWSHVKIPAELLNFDAHQLHRKNNGAAHRKFSDDDICLARKLFDAGGMTVAAIARKLGRSHSHTLKIVHRKIHPDIV